MVSCSFSYKRNKTVVLHGKAYQRAQPGVQQDQEQSGWSCLEPRCLLLALCLGNSRRDKAQPVVLCAGMAALL